MTDAATTNALACAVALYADPSSQRIATPTTTQSTIALAKDPGRRRSLSANLELSAFRGMDPLALSAAQRSATAMAIT